MSRRKRRSPERTRPPAAEPAPPHPRPVRPNRWFLLATAGLLAAWLAFLAAMALAS